MGLFRMLFGGGPPKNATVEPDQIWLTEDAKFNGIRTRLGESSTDGCIAVILVSHFTDVAERLQSISDSYSGSIPLISVSASELSSRIARDLQASENQLIEMIVAERHPLLEEDDRVLKEFAEDLPCKCRVSYHISLEDPLMAVFVNDNVRKMIRMLGMKEDEVIQSNMVHRRIRQAQQKFTQSATGNAPADTAQEWMEKNLPNR